MSVGVVGPNENRTDLVTDQDSDQDGDQDMVARILSFCVVERSKKEICKHFGYANLTYFTKNYLNTSNRIRPAENDYSG